jgi:hypothetical protein
VRAPARGPLTTGAAALAVALTLTACGPVNRGSSLGEGLEDAVRDLPGVVEVEGGGQNPLPWSGSASSTIVLAETASVDEVLAVAEAAAGQIAQSDGDLTATIEQPRAEVLLSIVLDEQAWADADLVRAAHEAASLVSAGTVRVLPTDTARPEAAERFHRVDLQVDAGLPADLPALLPALLALDAWDEVALALWSADGTAGYVIDPLTAATAEPVAVLTAADVPVLRADLGAAGGTLHVPPRAVPDARRVLAEALPDLDLTVTSQQIAPSPSTAASPAPSPAPGTPTPTS